MALIPRLCSGQWLRKAGENFFKTRAFRDLAALDQYILLKSKYYGRKKFWHLPLDSAKTQTKSFAELLATRSPILNVGSEHDWNICRSL